VKGMHNPTSMLWSWVAPAAGCVVAWHTKFAVKWYCLCRCGADGVILLVWPEWVFRGVG